MPSKTRRPLRKCHECGRSTHLTRTAIINLINGMNVLPSQRLEDPADLRYLVELSKHEPDYLRVSRTREELLHLVYLDLMKVTGPRDAECGVCLWTRLAHEYAQRGQPAEEVRSYNRASAFRTFYNSKLYRSAVEKQTGAAA